MITPKIGDMIQFVKTPQFGGWKDAASRANVGDKFVVTRIGLSPMGQTAHYYEIGGMKWPGFALINDCEIVKKA